MSSTETVHTLTPTQRRQLSVFVREYEQARDHAATVLRQAEASVRHANGERDAAYHRLLRAAELAVGSADVAVDFVTWEVVLREKVAEPDETT